MFLRAFEVVFALSVVIGVLTLKWQVVAVALAVGAAVALAHAVRRPGVHLDEHVEPPPTPKEPPAPPVTPQAPTQAPAQAPAQATCAEPWVGPTGPFGPGSAQWEVTTYKERVAERLGVVHGQNRENRAIPNESRRAFMEAMAPPVRPGAYLVPAPDAPPCPDTPLPDTLPDAFDGHPTSYREGLEAPGFPAIPDST